MVTPRVSFELGPASVKGIPGTRSVPLSIIKPILVHSPGSFKLTNDWRRSLSVVDNNIKWYFIWFKDYYSNRLIICIISSFNDSRETHCKCEERQQKELNQI